MQQQVHIVRSGGFHAEYLTIESVGEPGERVPVSFVESSECPLDRWPTHPCTNVSVVGDVAVVIVVDERMAPDRVVQGKGRQDKKKAENQVSLFGRGEDSLGFCGTYADWHGRGQHLEFTQVRRGEHSED